MSIEMQTCFVKMLIALHVYPLREEESRDMAAMNFSASSFKFCQQVSVHQSVSPYFQRILKRYCDETIQQFV
jgi:hypothetical protein